jgi:hypothetical protein
MPVESTHYAVVALFALSQNLEDEQNREAFEDILGSLRAFARRWPLAKKMYLSLQLTAVQEAKLPLAARILLSEMTSNMQSAISNSQLSSDRVLLNLI